MYCVMTCIRVMEMCMVLCSFCDNFAMCWGKYVMYLNFVFTCVFTALCIGIHSCALFVLCIDLHLPVTAVYCVLNWLTFCILIALCTLGCIFCGVHLIYWYLAVLGIHVHGYLLFVLSIGLLCVIALYMYIGHYCVFFVVCFGYISLYILFVSPTCSSDGGSGAGTFLCLSPSSRSANGIPSFKAPNNPGPFWYKKIESHY